MPTMAIITSNSTRVNPTERETNIFLNEWRTAPPTIKSRSLRFGKEAITLLEVMDFKVGTIVFRD